VSFNEGNDTDRLRVDYKGAFEEWAEEVSRWQKIARCAPGSPLMVDAEARVEIAAASYRSTRNRLIDDMLSSQAINR
jgi:hypothetical protein